MGDAADKVCHHRTHCIFVVVVLIISVGLRIWTFSTWSAPSTLLHDFRMNASA